MKDYIEKQMRKLKKLQVIIKFLLKKGILIKSKKFEREFLLFTIENDIFCISILLVKSDL
jgi:hypothetical protein